MKPPRLSFTPRILRTFDGHGAYVRAYEDYYFLCAADLNQHLDPGQTWEEPEARRRTAILLVAEIEVEPSASTTAGSFRFTDVDEYAQHRSRLTHNIRACRSVLKTHASALKLRAKIDAVISARS